MAYSKLPTRTSGDANAAADINQLTDNIEACMPIGACYVQYPGQGNPSDIGLIGTWTSLSTLYNGDFFRSEGGNAKPFEDPTGYTQADAFQGHLIGMNAKQATDPNGSYIGTANPSASGSFVNIATATLSIISDGVNGTPRTASETRPTNETIRIWKRTA